jgi:aminopeptidase N
MEDFTGSRYELPGLDLFAVPYLKPEAAGNWGLTTFRYGTRWRSARSPSCWPCESSLTVHPFCRCREKYLLLDDVSTTNAIESGLSAVQREVARQWFGNAVTCRWWDYVWLHDAFATYFQYFATHSVRTRAFSDVHA